MKKELTLKDIQGFEKAFDANKANKIAENAVQRNGLFNAAFDSEAVRKLVPTFNVEVKKPGSITNQKQSGRCWMFAGLNVIRTIAMKKLKVKDLELSQSYLMFFDKLEKSNYQLEAVLDHIDEPDNSRLMDIIASLGGQQDGGFWHFFTELVKKYGVCPKSAQPEVVPSSASAEMDDVLDKLLAKFTAQLRNEHRAGKSVSDLRKEKDGMLAEVYKVLTICLGKPVSSFEFQYTPEPDEKKDDAKAPKKDDAEKEEKKDPKPVTIVSTPKDFFDKYVGADLDQYVSLVNWPIQGYKTYQTYTVKLCNNVVGANGPLSVNLPIEELKSAAIKALKDNTPLWFACDVTSYSFRKEGYLATEVFGLDDLLSTSLDFDKGDKLVLRASQCNHAMTLIGVNLDAKGNPNRWKVENSWGDAVGVKGNFIMTDAWFDHYVYEVIVEKKYLPKKVLDALKTKPVELDPWAPVCGF